MIMELDSSQVHRLKSNGIEIRREEPPILIVEEWNKPYLYSDIKTRKRYLGWIEDGRGRRFELDDFNWKIIEDATN